MAGSLNKVMLIGNLGADPEVRRLNSGSPVVNISVATSDRWTDKSTGEVKERTEWHRVVIFNEGLCAIAEKYLKKGGKVYLEGELQTRKWQDKDGQDRYSTEVVLTGFSARIVLLGDGNGGGNRDPNDNASRPGNKTYAEQTGGTARGKDNAGKQAAPGASFSRELNDDIPF